MIEYVYFDAGGTLIEAHPSVGAVYARAGASHGLTASVDALEQAFRAAFRARIEREARQDEPTSPTRLTAEQVRLPRGRGPNPASMGHDERSRRVWWRTLVESVLEEVGFTGDREACFESLDGAFATPMAWRIFDDVLPTLRQIRERGVRMGVLSNWDYRLRPLLCELELEAWFDPILASAVEGFAKPDLRFFALAAERAGVPPQRILYVGDQTVLDLDPALAAGMDAFLIDRGGPCGPPRDRVISSLEDLIRRL